MAKDKKVDSQNDERIELLLVDGSALLHRAYHAYPKMTMKGGGLVNAVYGVASMLISALESIRPEYVSVLWDVAKPTFRHKMYVAYKAQRPKTDQELIDQIPLVYEMLDSFSINQLKQEGYEADDLIGSLAEMFKGQVDKVVVLTGDQDVMQLIEERVGVLVPGRGKIPMKMYGESEVVERYGVRADQIVDYKALVGDSSDNIPGVLGIGPKTAAALLQSFDTLDEIYRDLSLIEGKMGSKVLEKLREGKESAYLSRELSKIKRDIKVGVKLADMAYESLAKEGTREFFKTMNFKSLTRRVFGDENEKDDRQIGLF